MSRPEPSLDNSSTTSPVQRLLIAAGTLIVITLTVIAAILLAVRNPAGPTVTPMVTPTQVAAFPTLTPPPPLPTHTPTTAPATSTPMPPAIPTTEPTSTPQPPTATNTPLPPPPTATFTPVVVIVTATPLPTTPPSAQTPIDAAAACPSPANWVAYSVQSGDTLNTLAARTGVSVYQLQQSNCLTNLTLQAGQIVNLPFSPPTSTPTSTTTPVTPSPTPTRTGTPVRPPEIFSAVLSEQEQIITVTGRNFMVDDADFKVQFIGGNGPQDQVIEVRDLRLKSSTGFVVGVPSGMPSGTYDLYVINPDDQFDFVDNIITIP